MPWIRVQGLKKDGEGRIVAGTATIVDTDYIDKDNRAKGAPHSVQTSRKKLGRPLKLAEDRRSGIFISKEEGIVAYDADTDTEEALEMDDPRLEGLIEATGLDVHTVFGDGYLFLSYLKNIGMTDLLRRVFPTESVFQRCLAHLYHTGMKNGSKDRCDHFVRKSFVGYTIPKVEFGSLSTDTRFFDAMGDDAVRISFFKAFVDMRRASNPSFGRCCYVDSTPLPNGIEDNPFNAFSSHGDSGEQCRMVLVIDIDSGEPVWFKVIPGNVLDVNTLKSVEDDVRITLGIDICEYVLDSGYANSDLVAEYALGDAEPRPVRVDAKGNWVTTVVLEDDPLLVDMEAPDKTVVVKLPKRAGYGHMDMFNAVKGLLNNGKYDFQRENHGYFGIRKEVSLFHRRIYAYIYVDQNNALSGYNDFMRNHPEEFAKLKDKEKTWKKYASGFFVLLSNIREEPSELLDRYFGRCSIESVFKTAKEYLDLLPLKKWTAQRVMGKLLSDTISLIVYLSMRRDMLSTAYAVTEVPTITQSLICSLGADGIVRVDPPNRQTKQIYKVFGIGIPNQFRLEEFIKGTLA